MTAILVADIPQQDLHIGDQVTLLGPVVVGSTVAFAYRLPDGSVPLVPLPADAVRLEREAPLKASAWAGPIPREDVEDFYGGVAPAGREVV